MKIAEREYYKSCSNISDINEHLPTLRMYAENCDHITELGVRWIVSTWAFLISKPKKLISVDIVSPEKFGSNLQQVYKAAEELDVDFKFILGNDLEINLEETDLLFIDTYHEYNQLSQELNLLNSKVKKYIIMHDTFLFGQKGEGGGPGLLQAINEFIKINKNWKIHSQYYNNNGLTILNRF